MNISFALAVLLLRRFFASLEVGDAISSDRVLDGLSTRLISVSTLMFVLVGDVEMVAGSVLVLGDCATSGTPSLSFLPKTRPKMPPDVEDRFSLLPASLTI